MHKKLAVSLRACLHSSQSTAVPVQPDRATAMAVDSVENGLKTSWSLKKIFPKPPFSLSSLNSLVSRCLNLIFTVLPWHRSMELYCRCCCFHFTSISVPSGDDGVVTTHTHMHRDPTNGLFSPIWIHCESFKTMQQTQIYKAVEAQLGSVTYTQLVYV